MTTLSVSLTQGKDASLDEESVERVYPAFRGVGQSRGARRWAARLKHKGKTHYLGTFATPEEAAHAYDVRAVELFGSAAWQNLPDYDDSIPPSDAVPESGEEWREVARFAGVYEVSSLGRVRRIAPGSGAIVGRIMRAAKNSDGYFGVNLSDHDHREVIGVHVLVCEAFHGPRPDGHVCNHRDGIKANNESSNLEWATVKENAEHASRMGLFHPLRGEAAPYAKLTEDDVRAIRAARGTASHKAIAKQYGVCSSTITSILLGQKWKHVV